MARCPRCGQQAARRTRRVGLRDHLAGAVRLYPFRCQVCTARFRVFQGRRHAAPGGDRREYDRLVVRVPVTLLAGGEEAHGETVDLSLSGCTIRTEVTIAPGSTVDLRLRLGQAGDVWVPSAVVRTQQPGGLGVHFLGLPPAERARLGGYLARFLRPTGIGPRRRLAPRPQLVLVATVGVAIVVAIILLIDRIAGPPAP